MSKNLNIPPKARRDAKSASAGWRPAIQVSAITKHEKKRLTTISTTKRKLTEEEGLEEEREDDVDIAYSLLSRCVNLKSGLEKEPLSARRRSFIYFTEVALTKARQALAAPGVGWGGPYRSVSTALL